MKKIVIFIFSCLFALTVTSLSYAHLDGYKTKVKEGLTEMAKSPLGIADEIKIEYNKAEFKPFGAVGGFLKGGFYALGDFSRGLFRVMTFNVEDDNYFVNKFKK